MCDGDDVRITVEIPDSVHRRANAGAAGRGDPLGQFVTEALVEKLRGECRTTDKPWLASVGRLRHLRRETARISKIIEEEFERVD